MAHLLIHRGLAKKSFTENTISAFRYCFKKQYGIETDIHYTKDNKIVCFHDFSLKGKFKINKLLKNIKYKDSQSKFINNGNEYIATLSVKILLFSKSLSKTYPNSKIHPKSPNPFRKPLLIQKSLLSL